MEEDSARLSLWDTVNSNDAPLTPSKRTKCPTSRAVTIECSKFKPTFTLPIGLTSPAWLASGVPSVKPKLEALGHLKKTSWVVRTASYIRIDFLYPSLTSAEHFAVRGASTSSETTELILGKAQ